MKLICLIPLFVAACSGSLAPTNNMHVEVVGSDQQTDTMHSAPSDSITFTKEELLGQFEPSKHPDFVRIAAAHTTKENIYLRKVAYDAFVKMHNRAAQEGIRIIIISATRNFNDQKKIWEKKWLREQYRGWKDADKAKDILKYSSMPGTSRHHWGTDVDFNSVTPAYFSAGEGKKLYQWLVAHAAEFGFVQTYTPKSKGRTGYEEEQWHWSYLPLSGLMLSAYNSQISYSDIKGFSGSSAAAEIQVIEAYVNGVDTNRP
jgi:zinc D-Ala-D-Ala carboxypeptidase